MRLSWPQHLQAARTIELTGDQHRGTSLALMGLSLLLLAEDLLELARLALADADGTVRVGGAEILVRLVREQGAAEARVLLQQLQGDSDHRVVAAALNGLQS